MDVLARTGEPTETGQRDVLFVAVGAMARVALKPPRCLPPRASSPPWLTRAGDAGASLRVVELACDHRIVVTIEDGVFRGVVRASARKCVRLAWIPR